MTQAPPYIGFGGPELEESNRNEIQAKSNVKHLAPNLRLNTWSM